MHFNYHFLQVSGSNDGEKDIILPNSDTLNYFNTKGNFITYFGSPQTLGLLGYLLKTPSTTRADSSDYSEVKKMFS